MEPVAIVPTGTANLASVQAAFRRLSCPAVLARTPEDVERAERLVLPGVGAFATAMDALEGQGLAAPLRERFASGRPSLAICLGMQLLARSSDEAPGRAGLGVLPTTCLRLDLARVPRLGWSEVTPDPGCCLLRPGWASFAHSYALADLDSLRSAGWRVGATGHPSCAAAVERGSVLACQFHPELSGAWGEALIARWLRGAGAGAAPGEKEVATWCV